MISLLVPTLGVGTRPWTLRVLPDSTPSVGTRTAHRIIYDTDFTDFTDFSKKENILMARTHHRNTGPHSAADEPHDRLAAKKAAVLGNRPRPPMRGLLIGAACLALAVGAGAYYVIVGPAGGRAASAPAPVVTATDGVVTFPTTLFVDGIAKHFSYQHGDLTIKYFLVRSLDGVIRAAFDACDVCWPSGKGYYQQGDFMVCRNCGQRFETLRVGDMHGGCNPAPLIRAIDQDRIIIRIDDLLKGQHYFDFSQQRRI
jgi:uncharacterized membrane protein